MQTDILHILDQLYPKTTHPTGDGDILTIYQHGTARLSIHTKPNSINSPITIYLTDKTTDTDIPHNGKTIHNGILHHNHYPHDTNQHILDSFQTIAQHAAIYNTIAQNITTPHHASIETTAYTYDRVQRTRRPAIRLLVKPFISIKLTIHNATAIIHGDHLSIYRYQHIHTTQIPLADPELITKTAKQITAWLQT